MKLYVRPDGNAQCLYSDDISLAELGALNIKRASYVEPQEDSPGRWYVDLSPVGGPFITGYASRAEALKAEELWLNSEMRKRNLRRVLDVYADNLILAPSDRQKKILTLR